MSQMSRNRLLIECILQQEAETRHAIMFGAKVPERVMTANEDLWRAFRAKMFMVDDEAEIELANAEMTGLIRAHKDSCGDSEDENCVRLWRILG